LARLTEADVRVVQRRGDALVRLVPAGLRLALHIEVAAAAERQHHHRRRRQHQRRARAHLRFGGVDLGLPRPIFDRGQVLRDRLRDLLR
jgi:hypothetical protein